MKWIEAKVLFEFPDKPLAVDLISNIFYDFGLQGVVVEDTDIGSAEDWADGIRRAPSRDAVIGYLAKTANADSHRQTLEAKLERLKAETGILYHIAYHELDEEDWANSWKAFFWPEKVGARIVVKPTWRHYLPLADEIVIEVDPGMAFGTGTHPTTALCISLIEKFLKPGSAFLDVGTGSGILMIAAAKCGALRLQGIDLDEMAVEIAVKNLLQNGIEPARFSVATGCLLENIDRKFDFIAANILSKIILRLLDDVAGVLAPGATLVCSGIIDEDKQVVLKKLVALGFEIKEVRTQQKWVAIAAQLTTDGD